MTTNLLSAAKCKHATSNNAKIRKVHDGDGLYLRIYLDGRKYWRVRYWQADKEKSLPLGVYPKVTLSEARQKRDTVRKQLQADLDPSAERKATNARQCQLLRSCGDGVVQQTTAYMGCASRQ